MAIVFDGYDLMVYGSTVPTILSSRGGVTPAPAGLIGSLALVGMLVGTLSVGILTDRLGRHRIMLACLAWLLRLHAAHGVSPSAEVFGFLRS